MQSDATCGEALADRGESVTGRGETSAPESRNRQPNFLGRPRMYEIEKGVPLPEVNARGAFPVRKMAVGDSFLIPANDRVRSSAIAAAVYARIKVATRREGDNIRVWRVA